MKKEQFVYIPKIDSGKISIPLSQCEILNEKLYDKIISQKISLTTGEVYEENTQQGIPYQLDNKEDGTYLRIWVEPQINYVNGEGISELYISVLINSKHLHEDYFKGITKETLPQLYDYIISLKLFNCNYDSFRYSRFNDIDICFDFLCNPKQFEVLKKNIKSSVKDSSLFHSRNTKSNPGLYAPTSRSPRTQATPGKPYIKFYDKQLDLEGRSNVFAKKYLSKVDYTNLFRYECNIKSRKHLKRLGLSDVKTFYDLLDCRLQIICGQMFKEYFHKPKVVKVGNIKPMERVIIDFINICIEQGVPSHEIFKIFDRDDVSRQSKSDLIKKYHQIMRREEINKDELESNEITNNLFKYLGVDMEQIKIDFNEEDEVS